MSTSIGQDSLQQIRSKDFENPRLFRQNVEFLQRKVEILSASDQPLPSLLLQELASAVQKLRKNPNSSQDISALVVSIHHLAKKKGFPEYRIPTELTKKFCFVAHKLKTIAKGATIPGARLLFEKNWKEQLGLCLTIDGKVYQGKFVPSTFNYHGTHSHIQDWEHGIDERGKPFHEQYSFEEYMNSVAIPKMTLQERTQLQIACSKSVEQYTDEELETLNADIETDGRIYTHFPFLNEWGQIPLADRPTYQTFLKEKNLQPPPHAKFFACQQKKPYLYILTLDEKLYIHLELRGSSQHASLSRGTGVLSAGELEVNQDGTISSLTIASGHYRPEKTQLITMLEFLSAKGMDINALHVRNKPKENEPHIKQIDLQAREVTKWIQAEKEALIEAIEQRTHPHSREVLEKMPYRKLQVLKERK